MRDRLKFSILAFSVLFLFTVLPVNATFTWENNVTVGYDKVQWVYTETYTEGNTLIYKDYIDVSLGNQDGFISAWEILKTDVKARSTLQSSILGQMDVIVNNSSESVVLAGVSSSMSPELLGPVMQGEVITNLYTTNYHLENPFLGSGTNSISFIGEESTPLVINMPKGASLNSTEGIDNLSISNGEGVSKILGSFGPTGKATVHFHLDGVEDIVTSVPELAEMNVSGEFSVLNNENDHNFSLAERLLPALGMCNTESA